MTEALEHSAEMAAQALRQGAQIFIDSGAMETVAASLRTVLENTPVIKNVANILIAAYDANRQRNFNLQAFETMMDMLGEAENLAKELLDLWEAIEVDCEACVPATKSAMDGLIKAIEKAHGQVLSLEHLYGRTTIRSRTVGMSRAGFDAEHIHHISNMLKQSIQRCDRAWRAILDRDCMEKIKSILHDPTSFGCDEKVAEGLQDGTREWAFKIVNDWLEEEQQSTKPVLWIRARAGMGKSVLAAALARRYGARGRGRLLGALFVQFNDPKRSDPRELVKSLAVHHVLQAAKRLKLHHDKTLEHLLLVRLKELDGKGEVGDVDKLWVALVSGYWQYALKLKLMAEQEKLDAISLKLGGVEQMQLQQQDERKSNPTDLQYLLIQCYTLLVALLERQEPELNDIEAQVRESKQQLEALARPQLLIIDGLDEAATHPAAASDPLRQLLVALCTSCPFKVIVTSRPEDSRVDAVLDSEDFSSKVEKLTIEVDDELNQRDVQRVVQHILFKDAEEEFHEVSPEHRIVSHVAARSQGKFVYLRLVEGGLRGQGRQLASQLRQLGEEEIDKLLRDSVPASLDDAYSKYVNQLMVRITDPESNGLIKTVLRVLIAAGEAVSLSLLDAVVERPVQGVVSGLGVLYSTVEGRVVPYHKSFLEWVERLQADLSVCAGSSIWDVLVDLDEGRRLLLARMAAEVREVGGDPLRACQMGGEAAARECRNMAMAYFLRSQRYDLAAACVGLPWLVWRLCQPGGVSTLIRELRSVLDACQGSETSSTTIVELEEACHLVLGLLPYLQAACGEDDSKERRASQISSHICSRLMQQAGNRLIEALKTAAVQWVDERGGWRMLTPTLQQAKREDSGVSILPVEDVLVRDVVEVYSDLRGQVVTIVCLQGSHSSTFAIKIWDVESGAVLRSLSIHEWISSWCIVDSSAIAWVVEGHPIKLKLWRWEDAGGDGQDNRANTPEEVATIDMTRTSIAAIAAVTGLLVAADTNNNGFWLCSLETKACRWLACDVGKIRVRVEERQWQQTGLRNDLLFICSGENKWWLCRLAVCAGHGEEEGDARRGGDVKLSRLVELPGRIVEWAGRLSEDRLAVWMDGRVSVWRLRGYGGEHGIEAEVEVKAEKEQQFDCPLSVWHYRVASEDGYASAWRDEWEKLTAFEDLLGNEDRDKPRPKEEIRELLERYWSAAAVEDILSWCDRNNTGEVSPKELRETALPLTRVYRIVHVGADYLAVASRSQGVWLVTSSGSEVIGRWDGSDAWTAPQYLYSLVNSARLEAYRHADMTWRDRAVMQVLSGGQEKQVAKVNSQTLTKTIGKNYVLKACIGNQYLDLCDIRWGEWQRRELQFKVRDVESMGSGVLIRGEDCNYSFMLAGGGDGDLEVFPFKLKVKSDMLALVAGPPCPPGLPRCIVMFIWRHWSSSFHCIDMHTNHAITMPRCCGDRRYAEIDPHCGSIVWIADENRQNIHRIRCTVEETCTEMRCMGCYRLGDSDWYDMVVWKDGSIAVAKKISDTLQQVRVFSVLAGERNAKESFRFTIPSGYQLSSSLAEGHVLVGRDSETNRVRLWDLEQKLSWTIDSWEQFIWGDDHCCEVEVKTAFNDAPFSISEGLVPMYKLPAVHRDGRREIRCICGDQPGSWNVVMCVQGRDHNLIFKPTSIEKQSFQVEEVCSEDDQPVRNIAYTFLEAAKEAVRQAVDRLVEKCTDDSVLERWPRVWIWAVLAIVVAMMVVVICMFVNRNLQVVCRLG